MKTMSQWDGQMSWVGKTVVKTISIAIKWSGSCDQTTMKTVGEGQRSWVSKTVDGTVHNSLNRDQMSATFMILNSRRNQVLWYWHSSWDCQDWSENLREKKEMIESCRQSCYKNTYNDEFHFVCWLVCVVSTRVKHKWEDLIVGTQTRRSFYTKLKIEKERMHKGVLVCLRDWPHCLAIINFSLALCASLSSICSFEYIPSTILSRTRNIEM